MSEVMTVLGPIPADELGTTITHEHCLVDVSAWFAGTDDRPVDISMLGDLRRRPFSTTRDNMILDDEDLAARELALYRDAGGRSLVDVTCYGLGRDVLALRRISQATGLNVVASTGFYVEGAHPDWVAAQSADELAALMVREVVEGVDDTGIRCGVIGEIGLTGIPKGWGRRKVGAMTPEEEKVLRAAARASLETGRTVTVHTDPVEPRAALPAIDVLEEEGVDPSRIIIDHLDQVQDLDYHLATAARGVFVEYDSLGREHYADEWEPGFSWGHDAWRVEFVERLVESGHAGQLLFSHDVCLKMDLRAYGGNGYAHVLRTIVPTLEARGIDRRTIDGILVDNPRRALAVAS